MFSASMVHVTRNEGFPRIPYYLEELVREVILIWFGCIKSNPLYN